jgi:hypothetical protein
MYPEAFGFEEEKEARPKQDTSGLKAAASAGLTRLGGEFELLMGKAGFKDQAKAQREYEAAEKKASERFTPTEKGWTEDFGLKFRETLGGSLPSMVAPAAAGLAALALPVSAPVAIGAGLLGAGAVSAGQFTGSNLSRQVGTGKSLEEASGAAALGAAIPQALIDTAAMALIPGVGKLFGSVGSKLTTEQAKAIASQTLGKAAADYTAKTGLAMGREGFTEVVQQSLERLQAGLNIADPEAREEYIESFIGGAVLGGAIAPAGRYIERSGAKTQAARAERDERNVAAKEAAEQERVAAEKEAAERQTPEYALRIVNEQTALEQEKVALDQQIRKISKDSLTEAEDKAFNKEINAKLQINAAARNKNASEVSRVKQSGLYQQALERARVAGMDPFDYMVEQSKTVSNKPAKVAEPDLEGYYDPQIIVPSEERRKAEEAERARVAEAEEAERARVAAVPVAYAAERMELARTQTYDPTAQDYADYLLQDPYKALLVIETKTPLPGLSASESRLILNDVAKKIKAMSKEELAARQTELQGQQVSAEPVNPMAAFMEQSDVLDVDRRQGVTDSDIAFAERQAVMPTQTVTQGELFGGAAQRVNMPQTGTPVDINAQIADLEKQLDVAKSYGAPDSATRPSDREGRRANRERVSDLIEQIKDLKARQAKIEAGAPMGGDTDAVRAYIAAGTPERAPNQTVEDWYASLPENAGTMSALPEQEKARREAADARTAAAQDVILNRQQDRREAVVGNLLKEIQLVRGRLKPETITQIVSDVDAILNKPEDSDAALQALDDLSARWRAGTQRGTYGAATPTPTQTSKDMLLDQMDRVFAQRERYAPEVMRLLEQVAENFNAFAANTDRRNMVAEWLHRVSVTGRSDLARVEEIRGALSTLEKAATDDSKQLELGAELMPEAVAPQSETRVVKGKVQYVSPEDVGPLQGSAAERYAPIQKGVIFDTPEELDRYLASDYLKEARENQGLARETVSRLSRQVTEYETKIADTQKQIDALQERRSELQTVQVSERRAADKIIADTEVQLADLLTQLADDLGSIRMAYEQAELNLAAAEARSEETSRLIANNIASFEYMDNKVVRAAEATVAAKAELRKARNKLGSLEEKRPAIDEAQRKVIDALQRQRNPLLYEMQEKMQDLQKRQSLARVTQPRTVERLQKEIDALEDLMDMQRDNPYVPSSAMVTFLNNDLQLQMDAMQDRQKIGAAKRSVLHFKKKLDKAAADLKVDISTHPEVKALREQVGIAKELGTAGLRGVEGELALLDSEIEKAQLAQQATQRQADNIEDQIIRAGEERTFAGQLAAGTPDTRSALDRAEALAKDKQKLEEFQSRTKRLAALPGQRIDFSKRQEMFQMVNAATEDFAQLDADIEALREGVEELQVRDHFMHEEMLDLQDQAKSFRGPRKNSKAGKEHFAKMEEHKKKMEENNKRIQSLRDSITQYEKTRATKQVALAKAEQAMSSDPEVYQEITKAIDARMDKLDKTIAGKQAAVVKADAAILDMARDIKAKADAGKTAPEKLAKMRERLKVLRASQADRNKHLKEYLKERDVLKARRSNRLGIKRTLANIDALKEERDTAQARLRTQRSIVNSKDATKAEKAAAAKEVETLTESVADLNKRIEARPKKATLTEQEQFDAEVERVKELGKVNDRLEQLENALAAVEKAPAPAEGEKQAERATKLANLKAAINSLRNQQQEVAASLQPKTVGAVSQATKIESSAPAKLRAGTAESKAQPGVSRRPITESRTVAQPTSEKAVADANAFAQRLADAKTPETLDAEFAAKEVETQNQIIEAVEDNIARLQIAADNLSNELLDLNSIPATNMTPQSATRKEKVRDDLGYAERMLNGALRDRARLLKVQEEAEVAAPADQEEVGLPSGFKSFSGRDTIGNDDFEFEFSRGAPADGGQTVEALEKALDKVVGDPGVAGKRIKIFQSVSDLFNDPAYKYDYDGADIPADAKAFVNPKNGQVFMFADNIGKGEALGVLLHEVGVHIGFRNLFNKTQYARLVSAVKGWANRNDNSLESKIAKRAVARVEAAETTADQYDDELLAYAVEEAIKAGVNPDALQGGSPIRSWLKSVMDVLRNALSKYGINVKTLTTGDLVNMAYGAAQLELRGTWHGSDAAFTAFNTKYAGAGEGAFDLRFEAEKSLGVGPYTTPNKEYAEYYQHAVPFGKAANESGYGTQDYQDYRALDEMFLRTPNDVLSTAYVQGKFESRLVTAYLEGVSAGQSLDPTKNKNAQEMLNRLQTGARTPKEEKAAATLSLQKIKALKDYPSKGNLYRTLDDIPRSRIYSVNSNLKVGERPALDALLQKYGDDWAKRTAKETGSYPANTVFFSMREKVGIKKTTELLKAAGIDAIEQNNERGKFVERAYIDQAPEILGINLKPVGPAAGKGRPGAGTLLFSRGAPADALESLSKKIIAQPKTLKEKLGSNLALQLEMQGVDMRAGLRDTLKFGDDTLFTQAMYHVRKAEQKMAQMFTVMNSGPLVAYKDSKGLTGYRSSNQNSAREVFDAISDIPVDNPQLKTDLAQTYLVAVRANNKGLPKLDLGAMELKQADLDAALAAAEANPALKSALENVRRKYSAYNKGMIEFLASTQRITKKEAADLLKEGDYVPFYRVDKNGKADLVFNNNVKFNVGDIRRQPYLAELKGGDTKLLPLNEAIQRNTLLLTDMALTNNAAKSVAYGLQALGKGKGPVDPKTGKPSNVMAIKKGFGPDDAKVIRFYQEPDPSDPKDDGKRHIIVDTEGTLAEGIPAELVVQSLEGASLALPGFFKLGGIAADWLRAGVTRTPLYIARKLLREPMAASFTGGLESNAFSSVFKAGAEFLRMSAGSSDAQAKLVEKGLIQSNIFAGDMSDMKKMALQLASGKDQSAWEKVFAAADRYAMRADAATLALVLKNAEASGLSEVEADMATMESMNFYKRGLSPTLQYASRLIPFFNAQIQGLNVLVKAARGNMPFEEQQEIKRKFLNNALLLTFTGVAYAMAMEDDETFRNARPRDKYSNFFMPIPGVDEPLKLPIPFEAGYFFSLAVAAVDSMRAETDGKAQWQAIRDLFLGSIPGYSSAFVPQIVKPAFEVWSNKNFLTGGAVESLRLQGLDTEERYLATTTELAKQMSKAVPLLSPIQIEHIVRGYFGVMPLAAVAAANNLFAREDKGEKPAGRASDLPLVGTAFQKKYGGADADVVFREVDEILQTRNTFNDILKSGRREEAVEYRDKHRVELAMAPAAGQYRQVIGRINEDVRRTQGRNDLTPEEKRLRLDELDKARQGRAEAFIKMQRAIEARQGAD